jgi:hypothetical protein
MIKRTIITPTDYSGPDGTIHVTDARLRHWVDTFRLMRENKQNIPISWNPKGGQRFDGARSPQHAVGFLRDIDVIAGGAELTLDITDPAAVARANRGFSVAPVIYEHWRDGTNTEYTDAIVYVDMLAPPGDMPAVVALSLDPGGIALALRMATPAKVYRLAWPVEELSPTQISGLANWALGRCQKP